MMDAAEAPFDPEQHEAVQHESADVPGPTVTVLSNVLRRGYRIGGRPGNPPCAGPVPRFRGTDCKGGATAAPDVGAVGVGKATRASVITCYLLILIFGYFGYLLVAGWLARSFWYIGVSLVVGFVYGGLLWGVLPGQPGISWQGHLFGAIGGGLAAWWLGRADRRDSATRGAGT